jgi:hypothetical protein
MTLQSVKPPYARSTKVQPQWLLPPRVKEVYRPHKNAGPTRGFMTTNDYANTAMDLKIVSTRMHSEKAQNVTTPTSRG